ncbi:MAG: hypothetical protein OXC09_05950 [Truepera sp.]|nr:hypothetical protein [Truepera sp.]
MNNQVRLAGKVGASCDADHLLFPGHFDELHLGIALGVLQQVDKPRLGQR